jgi:hypothetical protein
MDFTAISETEWLSADGQYKIRLIHAVEDIGVRKHFHALVANRHPLKDGVQWGFAGRRGPYYGYKAAVTACQFHHRLWTKVTKLWEGDRAGRTERIRALWPKAVVGKSPLKNQLLNAPPAWLGWDAVQERRFNKTRP